MQTGVSKTTFRKCVWTVNSQCLLPLTPLKVQTVIELALFRNFEQPLQRFLHFSFCCFFCFFFPRKTPNEKRREGSKFLFGSPPFPPSILSHPYSVSCSLPSRNGKRLHETTPRPKKSLKIDFLGPRGPFGAPTCPVGSPPPSIPNFFL